MAIMTRNLFWEQATAATSQVVRVEDGPTAYDIHIDGTGTVELYVSCIDGPGGILSAHDKWGDPIMTWTASAKVEKDTDGWKYIRVRVIPGPGSTVSVAVGGKRLGD